MISRRGLIQGLGAAGGTFVAASIGGPTAVAEISEHPASAAWQALMTSLDGLIPTGASVHVLGNGEICRVEYRMTYAEPVGIGRHLAAAEWTIGSYRLTEAGWKDEGIFHGRAE